MDAVISKTQKGLLTGICHVIVLVIDGVRKTESWDDESPDDPRDGLPTSHNIPFQTELLKQCGVLLYNFHVGGPRQGRKLTVPGHMALVTGEHQQLYNDGSEGSRFRTILEDYALASPGSSPMEKTWVVTSKKKLIVLAETKRLDFPIPHMCGKLVHLRRNGEPHEYKRSDMSDQETAGELCEIMNRHLPAITVVNLKGPDHHAHRDRWNDYNRSIRECDSIVHKVWATIQSNPKLRDTTLVLVTHDHGRHSDNKHEGYINHGCNCAGCDNISLLALCNTYRGLSPSQRVETRPSEQIDVHRTIAHIFGIPTQCGQGRVLRELFVRRDDGAR
jgi:hypothetical protein